MFEIKLSTKNNNKKVSAFTTLYANGEMQDGARTNTFSVEIAVF